jgi:glycosyltransferase involved in cell wall biosynthesis
MRTISHRLAAGALHVAARRPGRRRAETDAGAETIHILLLHAWGMGGTIRATLQLAGRLAERHDVEVISVVRRRDRPFFAFPPGVRVTAIDDQRREIPAGPLQRRLRRHASRLLHPADRGAGAATLWTDVHLARHLLGIRSGVLVGTRPALNLLALDAAGHGVAAIGQEHMHLAAHPRAIRAQIARRYPALDALSVLTERDRHDYAGLVGDERVVAIPNAVPAPPGPAAALTEPLVVGAGRLTPQKGFGRLLRAFAPVAERHPGWRLRICGAGPRRGALTRRADALGLDGAAVIGGPVRDLDAVLAAASIFVLSSRFEGLPLVLLEAMAHGLAVVSFDCPTGPREVIRDGHDGLLVADGDVGALSAAIEALVADEALRHRLGAAARETARRWSPDAAAARWEELLAATSQTPPGGRMSAARRALQVTQHLRRRPAKRA